MRPFVITLLVWFACGCATAPNSSATSPAGDQHIRLGNFSVSLAVKNLDASRAFYEKLGFRVISGSAAHHLLILQNDTSTIGLFQGMFEKNTLTYNPGWNRDAKPLTDFEDVRDLQRELKSRGFTLTVAADESKTGPAFLMLTDPDGNPILVDQHVPQPGK